MRLNIRSKTLIAQTRKHSASNKWVEQRSVWSHAPLFEIPTKLKSMLKRCLSHPTCLVHELFLQIELEMHHLIDEHESNSFMVILSRSINLLSWRSSIIFPRMPTGCQHPIFNQWLHLYCTIFSCLGVILDHRRPVRDTQECNVLLPQRNTWMDSVRRLEWGSFLRDCGVKKDHPGVCGPS